MDVSERLGKNMKRKDLDVNYILNNFNELIKTRYSDIAAKVDEMEDGAKGKVEILEKLVAYADENMSPVAQIFVRGNLCYEKVWRDDCMAIYTLIPEMVAREDKVTLDDENYRDVKIVILCAYQFLLDSASEFYQISISQFETYFAEYRRRVKELGYSMRSVYDLESKFFWSIDRERALEAFQKFKKEPRDEICDCPACERRREVRIHLALGERKTADKLAKVLWEKKLVCKKGINRVEFTYLFYFLEEKNYEDALEQCKLIEKDVKYKKDLYEAIEVGDFIRCYIHFDMGKAIRYYEKSWKFAEKFKTEKGLLNVQNYSEAVCALWEAVEKETKTIKLKMPKQFPLYREDNTYSVVELYQYYDNIAKNIKEKFEERKRTYKRKE